MIVHQIACEEDSCLNYSRSCDGRMLYASRGEKLLYKDKDVKIWSCKNYEPHKTKV